MAAATEDFVLHVQTANPESVAQVDHWLRGWGLPVLSCPDAYAAIPLLRSAPAAKLVLVGLDGLPTEHDRLFAIIRQAWNYAPLVGYGASVGRVPEALSHVFLGGEVSRMLSLAPRALAADAAQGWIGAGQRALRRIDVSSSTGEPERSGSRSETPVPSW